MPCDPFPNTPNPAQHGVMTLARRITFGLGYTQTMGYATTLYVPSVITGAASQTLGVSRTALLAGYTLALLVYGAASPAVGRRIERVGGRMVLAIASPVLALGLLLLSLSQGLVLWYAGWLVIGLGMAFGMLDAAFGSVGRLLGREARPVIVGLTMMSGFASTIGWPLGTWLIGNFGWREMLVVYAAVQMALILPVTLLTMPRGKLPPPVSDPSREADAALPLGSEPGWRWLVVHFTLLAAANSMVSVHVLSLLQGFGFSAAAAVAAASLIGPAQVGSRVIDWAFGKRVTPMTTAMVAAIASPLSNLVLLVGLPAAVFGITYGIGGGLYTIARGGLALYVYGPIGYAARIGRLARPLMFASALVPTLTAPLLTLSPGVGLNLVMMALGMAAFCCLLMLRRSVAR